MIAEDNIRVNVCVPDWFNRKLAAAAAAAGVPKATYAYLIMAGYRPPIIREEGDGDEPRNVKAYLTEGVIIL